MAKKIKVYSAAIAIIFEQNRTKKEVWNDLTSIFDMQVEEVDRPSLMVNGWPLEKQVKKVSAENHVAGVGDIFKYIASYGSQIYIPITDWEAYNFFAYNEVYSPIGAKAISENKNEGSGSRMEFYLKDHFEGTTVEVIRRQKGRLPSRFNPLTLGERKTLINGATQLLNSVLNQFYKKIERYPSSMHVERDDSLKTDFEIK